MWRLIPAALVIVFIVWAGIKMTGKPIKWERPKRDYWEFE